MNIFSMIFGDTKKKLRVEAQSRGISITQVVRECPFFSRLAVNPTLEKLERQSCNRYSIPRSTDSGGSLTWTLLQRTEKEGAQFPNGYLLTTSGAVTEELRRAVDEVAREYDEEFFEFEATSSEVAVYWEEWGGVQQLDRIQATLEKLSKV